MPAAAVIPAPGAYTSVVAVKTLVVGCWLGEGALRSLGMAERSAQLFGTLAVPGYCEQNRVLHTGAFALNVRAWDNGRGLVAIGAYGACNG